LQHGTRQLTEVSHHTTITILRPFFWAHPGEPVPEENFWTLWCKGRLTEADTLKIWLGATPSGLTSAHLDHPSNYNGCCTMPHVSAARASTIVNCHRFYMPTCTGSMWQIGCGTSLVLQSTDVSTTKRCSICSTAAFQSQTSSVVSDYVPHVVVC